MSPHPPYGTALLQGLCWDHLWVSIKTDPEVNTRVHSTNMFIKFHQLWTEHLITGAGHTDVTPPQLPQQGPHSPVGTTGPSQLREQPEGEKSKRKQQSGHRLGWRLLRVSSVGSRLDNCSFGCMERLRDEAGETVQACRSPQQGTSP